MKHVIQTIGLSFIYSSKKVINNLNIDVPDNSIYGFLGPNGAGKSTTIKLLLGLLQPKVENIYLFGSSLKARRNEILRKTGNLIEEPTVYSHLTAWENLRYLDYIFKKGAFRMEKVLRIIGLWEERKKKVRHFSTGMKKRLGIGMAIFHDPQLLILDEPVNGLDPNGVYEIRKVLNNLRNEGKTIFISSHLLSEIEKLCTHVGIINNGDLLYQGSIDQLLAQTSRNILVQTSDNIKALEVLNQNNCSASTSGERLIVLKISNKEELSYAISLLTHSGIGIYDIEKQSSNLEDIFLNLTTN